MGSVRSTRGGVRGDAVGFLINGKGGAEEKRVLFILSLEVLERFPKVVVSMTWLKGGELKGVDTRIGLKGPWKPAVGMHVFYAVAMRRATNGKDEKLLGAGTEG